MTDALTEHPRCEVNINYNGLVVGPDQYLVLIADRPITMAEAEMWKNHMPKELLGRVLICDQVTGYVVDKATFEKRGYQ